MIRNKLTDLLKEYYKETIIALNIFMLLVSIVNSLSLAFTFLTPRGSFKVALYIYIGNYTTIMILILNIVLVAWLILKLKIKTIPLILPLSIVLLYQEYSLFILSVTASLTLAILFKRQLKISIQKIITVLLTIFLIIETGTFIEYMLYIFKIADVSFFQKFHIAFFYALYPLVPALYLIMLFSYLSYFALFNVKLNNKNVELKIGRRTYIILVSLVFALATFFGIAIYLPTLNPRGRYIGVDPLLRYIPHLRLMFEKRDYVRLKKQKPSNE